ncbi:MAG: phenylhydantoinase [Latescibacteria bacterium DG_63]|nr:MAG: phenylhydantoinase [Latescibacteria bacterium DG_63]
MGLLIKQGEIITAAERFKGDIYCEGGKITAIGPAVEKQSAKDEVIDASGAFVLPGGVEPHVHMELPFMGSQSSDDFETGTAAGVAGGTTTIMDLAIPGRGQSLLEGLKTWMDKAEKAVSDYALHMAVTWYGEKTSEEIAFCVREAGTPSFKSFMAYKGAIGVDDEELFQIMTVTREAGGLTMIHAEHGDVVAALQKKLISEGKTQPYYHPVSRPSYVEGEATSRAIMIARATGQKLYIVHMTCREALEAVTEAKLRGQEVYAETCPQYLLLDDEVYKKPDFEGAAYVMSPPIRPKGHQETLWGGIEAGIFDTIGTDHCPFNLKGQKEMGKDDFTQIPNGAGGVEHRLQLLYTYGVCTGRIDMNRFVDLVATRPAKIFGLYPRKGSLLVGGDADILIFDPSGEGKISASTHHQRCDRNIYEGFAVKGRVAKVILRGRVGFSEGDLKVERGAGRFIKRPVLVEV